MITFPYFPANVHIVRPLGVVTLDQFYRAISNPNNDIKAVFQQIRKASEDGNIELKQQLKEKLYYFTPAVNIPEHRCYKGISSFTGILPIDFDKMDNAAEFKEFLFNDHPFVMSAWLSASGNGVRALVKIPVSKDIAEFKEYFAGVEQIEPANFRQYFGFDAITKNCTQPVFLSYDPNILIRENATIWTQKYIEYIPVKPPFKSNHKHASFFQRKAETSISRITNEGHYILRATAFMLGGYVGSGMLDQFEAIDIINRCIDNHPYLSKKPNVYKKTALTMINKGIFKPLTQ